MPYIPIITVQQKTKKGIHNMKLCIPVNACLDASILFYSIVHGINIHLYCASSIQLLIS